MKTTSNSLNPSKPSNDSSEEAARIYSAATFEELLDFISPGDSESLPQEDPFTQRGGEPFESPPEAKTSANLAGNKGLELVLKSSDSDDEAITPITLGRTGLIEGSLFGSSTSYVKKNKACSGGSEVEEPNKRVKR